VFVSALHLSQMAKLRAVAFLGKCRRTDWPAGSVAGVQKDYERVVKGPFPASFG